jgi:hypothetical protein
MPIDWPVQVWRAAARFERDDVPAADPMFEHLLEVVQSAPPGSPGFGPTGAAIAEGALRCRVARGSQVGGVFAFLEWALAARWGPPAVAKVWSAPQNGAPEWIGGKLDAPAFIDDGTGLVADLPPMFVGEPSVLAMGESALWARYAKEQGAGGTAALIELSGWYRAAVQFESGLTVERPASSPAASHEGLRLLRDVVISRIGDAQERDAARTALRARIEKPKEEPPAWIEAWCRCAIGRSLIREDDNKFKRQGVLELLHVPARFSRQSPYLAGLALAESAAVMDGMGEKEAASILLRELNARWPRHGALDWDRLGAIAKPTP